MRACERLTDQQRDLLIKEYLLLPRRKNGMVMPGYRDLLARKWGMSVWVLVDELKRRGVCK